MPTISRFYGIVIYMYHDEHGIPHFHAKYQDEACVIGLDGKILEGKFPKKQLKIVQVWIFENYEALILNWELAQEGEAMIRIAPLE